MGNKELPGAKRKHRSLQMTVTVTIITNKSKTINKPVKK